MQYSFKDVIKASQMANQSLDSCFPKDCSDDGSISYSNSSIVYDAMKTEANFNPVKRIMAWLFYKMDESIAQKRARDLEKEGYGRF